MNIQDAAFNLAEDYRPGGASAVARGIGKNPTTLLHEVKETGGAKLGLVTAVKMTKYTGDLRILLAFATECGQMCIPLPQALDLDTDDCMVALAGASREFAELCQTACTALADGSVSDNEMRTFERAAGELVNSIQGTLAAFRARNLAGKPAELRVA